MSRTAATDLWEYAVFGLRIRSALMLPELARASGQEAPDVAIRLEHLPEGYPATPGIHAVDDVAVLVIENIGRYLIRAGSEIIIEPAPGAAERNIRLYLLGSALGLLLHQRGLLALHANAIDVEGKAVLFMGASGEGKSTLAAWLHDRGHRIIADDVCVVRFDAEDRPIATPGLPRLRLWKEVLEASGRQPSEHERSYAGDETWEKYDVPLAPDRRVDRDTPIAAVYLLRRGNGLNIMAVGGVDAADALFANTYRGAYVATMGDAQAHYQACLTLVRQTPIFAVSRRWDLAHMEEDVGAMLTHATEIVRRLAAGR